MSQCEGGYLSLVSYSHDGGGIGIGGVHGGGVGGSGFGVGGGGVGGGGIGGGVCDDRVGGGVVSGCGGRCC